MLINATSLEAINEALAPAWVEEWLAGREARAKRKQEKAEAPPKPVDVEAQEQRWEKRMERIGAGLSALKIWVEDLVRGGIAALPSKGYQFFDEPARRMIDAQAPGAARRIKRLGEIASSGAGWQTVFTENLAALYLLIRAFEDIGSLRPDSQEDVLAALGMPAKSEDASNLIIVPDIWQVVAQEVIAEDRLRVQRTWLYGSATSRAALVLAFAHGTAPLDSSLTAGLAFKGEVCFYPGNGLRALVKSQDNSRPIERFEGLSTLDQLCDAAGGCFARQPWLEEFTAPLLRMTPVKTESAWLLIDGQRRTLPAKMSNRAGWKVLALSGGNPLDVVAGYDGNVVRPLAVMLEGQYLSLIESAAQGA
jgi:hypothetical protein